MPIQRVHHDVTRDRGVAISGKYKIYAVTFTFKIPVQRSALMVWWLIPILSVVSFNNVETINLSYAHTYMHTRAQCVLL